MKLLLEYISNLLSAFVKSVSCFTRINRSAKVTQMNNNTNNNKKGNYSSSRFILFRGLFNKMGSKLTKKGSSNSPRTTLKEEEINLLVSNTTMTREQIIDFHENFLKDCPSGYLTKKDFVKFFNELHPIESKRQKADKFCEYVFRALDEDSNNVISFTDFVVCFSITSFGNLKEKISMAFRIYDLDKNKVVDKTEMLKVLEALYDLAGISENDRKGDYSPKQRVESIFKKLDKNMNNVLEFDEFFDGCMDDDYVRKIIIDPMFNC